MRGAHEAVIDKVAFKVHLETAFDGENTLKALDYEMELDCRGYKFLGPPNYMTGDLAQCLAPDTNQI